MTDNNIKTNTSNLVRMTPLSVENREGSPSSKFSNFVESQSKVDDLAAEIMFCNLPDGDCQVVRFFFFPLRCNA